MPKPYKFDPTNWQTWFYFPIVMPLDEKGQGPSDMADTAKLTWEVWDQELNSHASYSILHGAITHAIKLNQKRAKELSRPPNVTLDVGDGSGNLFVHGDHDSIKAVQTIIDERNSLLKQLQIHGAITR